MLLNINIESVTCSIGSSTPGCDRPAFADEGNFREFAITRYLWDAYDSGVLSSDGDTVDSVFDEVWAVMTSTIGFRNSAQAFRNIGLLNEVHDADLTGATDLSSLQTNAYHWVGPTNEYARYVAPGTCSPYPMTPVWNPTQDSGSFTTSNRVRNNDFFFIKHPGGAFNLRLNYTTTESGPAEERESDLDLYIYNESARYGNSNDIVGVSQDYYDNNMSTAEFEQISRTLPAGDYLINVRIFTGTYDQSGCIGSPAVQICQNDRVRAGDPLTYTLTFNGSPLCPAPRP